MHKSKCWYRLFLVMGIGAGLLFSGCPAWNWPFEKVVAGLSLYRVADDDLALSYIVQDKRTEDTLALFGARASNGALRQLGGVVYTGVSGCYVTVYLGEDGRPSQLVSDDGWRVRFAGYGAGTVSLEIESSAGRLYQYASEVLPEELQEALPIFEGLALREQFACGSELLYRALAQFELVLPWLALQPPAFVTHGVGSEMAFLSKLSALGAAENEDVQLAVQGHLLSELRARLAAGKALVPILLSQSEAVREGGLIGRWAVTDAARAGWRMEALLWPDGSFSYTEYTEDTAEYVGDGTWRYSESGDFSISISESSAAKCFRTPRPSVSGKIAGDWGEFTVSGRHGDGASATFLWTRAELNYGDAVLVAVDGLSFPNTLLQLPEFLQEETHHYVRNSLLEMDLALSPASIKSFPWTLDGFLSDQELGRMQRFLRQYHSLARAQGGPFIVVAHSWGTFLTYTALSFESLREEPVVADLYITLSSPLGTAYAHEGELYAEEIAITMFTEEWLEYLGQSACEACYLPVGEHDNYWFWGDPVSGPLAALSPTVNDILLGGRGESDGALFRNLMTFPLWHYHSSLMGNGPIDNTVLRGRIRARINGFIREY